MGCSTGWIYGFMGCVELSVGLNLDPASSHSSLQRASVSLQRSLEALQCSRSAGVILSQHSGQVWAPVLDPNPIPLLGSHLPVHPTPNTTPQLMGLGVEDDAPGLHPCWGLHPGHPKSRGDTPQAPARPLSHSQLRGVQTSRWRCAITCREWEPAAPGSLPVCAEFPAPVTGMGTAERSREQGRDRRIFGTGPSSELG